MYKRVFGIVLSLLLRPCCYYELSVINHASVLTVDVVVRHILLQQIGQKATGDRFYAATQRTR